MRPYRRGFSESSSADHRDEASALAPATGGSVDKEVDPVCADEASAAAAGAAAIATDRGSRVITAARAAKMTHKRDVGELT
jgi:hypothetical protein